MFYVLFLLLVRCWKLFVREAVLQVGSCQLVVLMSFSLLTLDKMNI